MRLFIFTTLALILCSSTFASAPSVDEHQWVPEMYKCGNNVYQFICTVSDTVNSISTCRPSQVAAAEDAWTRFTDDFGIDEKTTLICKKLW